MKINGKILALVGMMLTAITLSLWVVTWASETFFFDKFYYQKSVGHGYLVPGKNILKDFGKRGQDMANLSDFISNPQHNTLGAQTEKNVFTIAVFGDSFVWGQGIKEQDRFVNILEQRLNKIRPTKVLSFARSGDGIIETYIKYDYVRKSVSVNFFLFTIVNNDLLIHEKSPYDEAAQQRLIAVCGSPVVFDPPTSGATAVNSNEYYQTIIKSYNDQIGNHCIFRFVLDRLPKQRAKYFYYSRRFWGELDFKGALAEYKQRGLDVFSSDNKLKNERIERLFVSPKEEHPSAFANKTFADTIYSEIIKLDYFYQ